MWITQSDACVRDDHAALHGKYFRRGESALEPGDDYNCRCFAQPAYSPDDALSENEIEVDLRRMGFPAEEILNILHGANK